MEKTISFEQMPSAIAAINSRLEHIELLLKNQPRIAKETDTCELLGVEETAKFLRLSTQTIYGKVSKGELPVMKRTKKLYFSKSDLIDYLKRGRRKTNHELKNEL